MNVGANAGASAGASAAVAAAIQATRASGVIVSIEPEDFRWLLQQNDEPLVVHTIGGLFSKTHRYLTSYRGLAFFTKSPMQLSLPQQTVVIETKKIWIPGISQ